jgi:hypothetical protein
MHQLSLSTGEWAFMIRMKLLEVFSGLLSVGGDDNDGR